MNNYFDQFTWYDLIRKAPKGNYNVRDYHDILCPPDDYPDFLDKYINLPLLQRLGGIGLLCGSDWTKLFNNRFYYSRLDHSVGVALITWHFTHDKVQTIAGLLHDISTPVFSHVSDFRKGDALTQTATEAPTSLMIKGDSKLNELLMQDGLSADDVDDYHKYPVADNEIPQLSADRLEYMYPSGMALEGSWSLEEVARTYNDLAVLKNEQGIDELGFKHVEIAEEYCRHFCITGHILQMNEDKLTLHLMGQIMNLAVEENLLHEDDFMTLTETQILQKLEQNLKEGTYLARLYKTFRNMESIEHTDIALPKEDYFNISLKVKQRYINPLVLMPGTDKAVRLNEASAFGAKIINDFLAWEDKAFGCVKLL